MNDKIFYMMDSTFKDDMDNVEPIEIDESRIFDMIQACTTENRQVKKIPSRLFRILVAAALILAFSALAYGTSEIVRHYGHYMGSGEVDYFISAQDKNEKSPIPEPAYFGALDAEIALFNSPVKQTVELPGMSITFDTVAVDDNFINAFFTIVFDEPLDIVPGWQPDALGHLQPAKEMLRRNLPYFDAAVYTDEPIEREVDLSIPSTDAYMVDSRTAKIMGRWIIPFDISDEFGLIIRANTSEFSDESLLYDEVLLTEFDLPIDKSAPTKFTRSAISKELVFETDDASKRLDLRRLAISPFGGVVSIDPHWLPEFDKPDSVHYFANSREQGLSSLSSSSLSSSSFVLKKEGGYASLGEFMITDDRGNVLNLIKHEYWVVVENSRFAYEAYEFRGYTPNTQSITITPIYPLWDAIELLYHEDGLVEDVFPESYEYDFRSYSVDDIGVKIPTSSLGGFILESFEISGSRVTWVLRPYGWSNYQISLEPDVRDLVEIWNNPLEPALQGPWARIDYSTGNLIYTVDFNPALSGELFLIKSFVVPYDGDYQVDADAAITLPLMTNR